MQSRIARITIKSLFVKSLLFTTSYAEEIEVMHWWTSGGEKTAVEVLKQRINEDKHRWVDAIIVGGGGENAMNVLKQRAISGNPPHALQMKGPQIQNWSRYLVNIRTADSEKWDRILPDEIKKIMKVNGQYVGAPVNVHRVDWIWANAELVNPILTTEIAKSKQGFERILYIGEQLNKQGKLAFAHGGQEWQDATAGEIIALSVGGPDFYQKAYVELDVAALKSPTSLEVFKYIRRYVDLLDHNRRGQTWDEATKQVIDGKAGMQLMGDWAKGEFLVAGQKPGKDFLCLRVPSTHKQGFLFNVDSFVFFKVQGLKTASVVQESLAHHLMSSDFQELFNLKKGSIPVRRDAKMAKFDQCAQRSSTDFKSNNVRRLPSWAHHMAQDMEVTSSLYEVFSAFFNNPRMTPQEAVAKLARKAEEHTL